MNKKIKIPKKMVTDYKYLKKYNILKKKWKNWKKKKLMYKKIKIPKKMVTDYKYLKKYNKISNKVFKQFINFDK